MPFHVSFPDGIRQRLAILTARVRSISMGKELARVLFKVVHDLTERPREIGETMYDLHQVHMPVKVHTVHYIGVVFAVHESSKSVMVTKMTMLENHPFPPGYEDTLNQ
jgi:hypothetical protein